MAINDSGANGFVSRHAFDEGCRVLEQIEFEPKQGAITTRFRGEVNMFTLFGVLSPFISNPV